MRASFAPVTLLAVLIGPALASEPPPHKERGKPERPRIAAGKTPDPLPVPDVTPRDPDPARGPYGEDRSLHFGAVTLTPGGFLDVGRRGAPSRD